MSEPVNPSRRAFVTGAAGILGGIIGASIVVPAIGYAITPAQQSAGSGDAWMPLGPMDSFPVGTPTPATFTRTKVNGWESSTNSYTVYVLRATETEAKVLSSRCTHLSCRVKWDAGAKAYICPCHDAHFGIDGQVLSGPPPSPLDTYETKIDKGILLIHVMEA